MAIEAVVSERARQAGVFEFACDGAVYAFPHRPLNPVIDLAVAQTRAIKRVRALIEGDEAAELLGVRDGRSFTPDDAAALAAVVASAEMAALVLLDWPLRDESGQKLRLDAATVVRVFLGNEALFKSWSRYIEGALEDAAEGNAFAPSPGGSGTGAPDTAPDAAPCTDGPAESAPPN